MSVQPEIRTAKKKNKNKEQIKTRKNFYFYVFLNIQRETILYENTAECWKNVVKAAVYMRDTQLAITAQLSCLSLNLKWEFDWKFL